MTQFLRSLVDISRGAYETCCVHQIEGSREPAMRRQLDSSSVRPAVGERTTAGATIPGRVVLRRCWDGLEAVALERNRYACSSRFATAEGWEGGMSMEL